MAMQWTMAVKGRIDTPRGWSLLGFILGTCVGTFLVKYSTLSQDRGAWREKHSAPKGTWYRGKRYPIVGSPGVYAGMVAAARSREQSARSSDAVGTGRRDSEVWDRSESLATPIGSRIPPMPPLDDLSTKTH